MRRRPWVAVGWMFVGLVVLASGAEANDEPRMSR